MKILDCTLRDGGYYTDWDFPRALVSDYCKAMCSVPVDYIEVGYRGYYTDKYYGEYYYLPEKTLEFLKSSLEGKKIGVMLNAKEWGPNNLIELKKNLVSIRQYVDFVRIATNPRALEPAFEAAKVAKVLGFEVYSNLMYSHVFLEDSNIIDQLSVASELVNGFFLVDSYGCIFPEQTEYLVRLMIKKLPDKKLGFHGHNNLELAFANAIAATRSGCEVVDSTITGMGRGSGNLSTELCLAYKTQSEGTDYDLSSLTTVYETFKDLKDKMGWGTNFAYILSGISKSPQQKVSDLLQTKRYSTNMIGKILTEKTDVIPKSETDIPQREEALVLGGGNSIFSCKHALIEYIERNPNLTIIYASTNSLRIFGTSKNESYLCLAGDSINDLDNHEPEVISSIKYIIPIDIPVDVLEPKKTAGITRIKTSDVFPDYLDSPLTVALSFCKKANIKRVYLSGFDGYKESDIGGTKLFNENQRIMYQAQEILDIRMVSKTSYDIINRNSIFNLLTK